MTMTAIMFAGDDEDVVEASVRNNLHHVDAIFLVGIDSRDGTRGIVEHLASEGLPVAYKAAAEGTSRRLYAQAAMAELAEREGVSHLVFLGADTFLEASSGAVRDAVETAPDRVHVLPRVVRAPTDGDDWGEVDPHRRLKHARLAELNPRFVGVIPRALFGTVPLAADLLLSGDDVPHAQPIADGVAAQLPVRHSWQFASLVMSRVGEITLESSQGLSDRRERVEYWMGMGDRVRERLLLSPFLLREAAAGFEADGPSPLVPDTPRHAGHQPLCYPAESAMALDRANAFIAEMHSVPARRAE